MQTTVSSSSPHFKMVFLACMGITIFCLAVMLGLAFVDKPNSLQQDLFGYCKTIVTGGVGAIFGLIGGKLA